MKTVLLATDLDDTLVGDAHALKQLNSKITSLRSNLKLRFVYVTGRSLEAYLSLQQRQLLLTPDAIITDVGTQMYEGNEFQPIDWPMVNDWDKSLIKKTIRAISNLEEQPAVEQGKYRISYYLNDRETYRQIVELLQYLPVDVLYSSEKYLDVLPKGINKGSALGHLAKIWSINGENIIACGDSANDIAMLHDNRAIIVGNAKQELVDWANSVNSSSNYLASKEYSAGIIEGLQHFGIL